MKNRNELFIVVITAAFLAFTLFTVLGTGCRKAKDVSKEVVKREVVEKAYLTQCTNNLKKFAQANYLYSVSFNGYVTPIAWQDGVNVWPAIIWNELNSSNNLPYGDYSTNKDKWLGKVKESHMFECPADSDSANLSDSGSNMPKLSYAINRSAVYIMKDRSNAASIPNGPVLKVTKFKLPSQMIYASDTAWNKSASGADAPGRLYATKSHPRYNLKPGSVCHPWDQSELAADFTGKSGKTDPWHTGESWNYAFMDGHVENLRPQQTIKGVFSSLNREPGGYWTWNQKLWGQD